MHEAAKGLASPSALRAAKIFKSSSHANTLKWLENSSALKAIRAFENSSAMRTIRALEKSSHFKAIKWLENSHALNVAKTLENSSRYASFNALAEKFSSQLVGPLTLSEAYQVVAENYLQTSSSSEVERMEDLSNTVDSLAQNAPSGTLSLEFYLATILALFLFWLSHISSMESEEKILHKFDQLGASISQQLSELKHNEEVETFYVVIRTVNLRVKPNTNSAAIDIIYPNTKTKLIRRKAKWIMVEYFDHVENTYKSGWVYKKYLKILNPKKKK